MGAFDALVETTKLIGRESKRLVEEAQAKRPAPQATPVPVAAPPPVATPPPAPVLGPPAPLSTPEVVSRPHFIGPPSTMVTHPGPGIPESTPTPDEYKAPELQYGPETPGRYKTCPIGIAKYGDSKIGPMPEPEFFDPDALDDPTRRQKTDTFLTGYGFNETATLLGDISKWDEQAIGVAGASWVAQENGTLDIKFRDQNYPEEMKKDREWKDAYIAEQREVGGGGHEEDMHAKDPVAQANARADDLLLNMPFLNEEACTRFTQAEYRELHPYDWKYLQSTPEGSLEYETMYWANLLIRPDMPQSGMERAVGLYGRAYSGLNSWLKDPGQNLAGLVERLPGDTALERYVAENQRAFPFTLGNLEQAMTETAERNLPEGPVREGALKAIEYSTDPLFLAATFYGAPGFLTMSGTVMEKIGLLAVSSVGAGYGGELSKAAGLPPWVGETAGMLLTGGSYMKYVGRVSPSMLTGKARPAPFANDPISLTNNLANKPWAAVSVRETNTLAIIATDSAETVIKKETAIIKATDEAVALLRKQGYSEAYRTKGIWLDNGVRKEEWTIFVPGMSPRAAAELGAAQGQKFVLIPEGALDPATNMIHPADMTGLRVGSDIPAEFGQTMVRAGGRKMTQFHLPVNYDELVPYIPGAGITADLGPATTGFHVTSATGAAGIERLGGIVPTAAADGTFPGVYYFTEKVAAEKAAPALARAAEAAGQGTGGARVVPVFAPEGGRFASQAVAEETAARLGLKNTAKDMTKLAEALSEEGYIGAEISGGRRVVFKPGDVVASPVPPVAGGAEEAAAAEALRVTNQPGTAQALVEGVSAPFFLRRVYGGLNKLVGKVPGLNNLHGPFNPNALLREPIAKKLAGLYGWLDWAASCDKMNLAALYVAERTGWMSNLLKKGTAEVRLTKAGAASAAHWVEGGRVMATWNDILTYGATYYELSAIDTEFVGLIQQTLREYGADLKLYGIDLRELLYEEGQGWIGRGSQAGKNGIEALQHEYSGKRMVGGGGSFTKSRIYETQAEAVKNGVDINSDAWDVIATTLTGMRRMQYDAQLASIAQEYGRKMSEIISPALKEAPEIVKAYRAWDRRMVDYISKQMKDLTVEQPFRRLRPVAGQVPDTWYMETVEKVQGILDRFMAEAKEARAIKNANRRVRLPGLSKAELNKIAKPYKAEMQELLDSAKLRRENVMETYFQVKGELEAEYRKIRGSLIAGPKERIRPEYFKDKFPEDSFAIGTIPGMLKLQGTLFPEDIVKSVEKVLNDGGNTVSAAIQKLNDVPRTLQTGFDLNFPFIQGLPLLFRNPVAFGRAYGKMWDAMWDPTAGMKYMVAESQRHPEEFQGFLKWVRQMGEGEYFQSARQGGFVYKTPGVGRAYARAAVGFDTMLDLGRWEYWKSIFSKAKTDGDFESLGAVTRDLLGTTSTRGLGIAATQRQIEGGILMFAPRYTRSAFGLLAWAFSPGVAGHEARRAIVQMITGGTALYYATCKALGQEPRFNPMDSGFMSVRVGDNYLGMGGVFRSMLRSLVWSYDAARKDPSRFYDPARYLENPVFEFFRSRTSPVTSKFIDIYSGKDFIGRPTMSDWDDIAGLMRRTVTPFGVDTILDSKGAMLPRMGAIVGEFFLGRSTPVSVNQLRDEAVYRWTQEKNITVHDVKTGKARPPETYKELTDDQRVRFDQDNPKYSEDVRDDTKANERAWAKMDKVYAETERQLVSIHAEYDNSSSSHYQDGVWYRGKHADILSSAYVLREDYYAQNPAADSEPTTREQKWATDYLEKVVKASVDKASNETDFILQEELDRQWRRDNGPEASAVIDREYAASMDKLDNQFRADNIILRPFFDVQDSAWSQDFLYEVGESVTLPMLSNGQTPLNFRTAAEYRSALRADFLRQIYTDGKLPEAYLNVPSGEGTLADDFSGRLSETQSRRAAELLVGYFVQPFYDKLNPVITAYLQDNPKYLEPLQRWGYKPGSLATDPYLP